MVAVPDRSSETLKTAINEWIVPGTTLYTDCWKGYKNLDKEGFAHWTVNHSLYFVDPDTGIHTNTIESMWRHAKVYLLSYNRQSEFQYYLYEYLFRKCLAKGVNVFTEFLEIVREINWDEWESEVGLNPTLWILTQKTQVEFFNVLQIFCIFCIIFYTF